MLQCPGSEEGDDIEVILDEPREIIDHLVVIDYCRDVCLSD